MSVDKSQYSWSDPFQMRIGPTYRRVVELSDLTQSWSINSTGQSGNPLSDHYDDQLTIWLDNNYRQRTHPPSAGERRRYRIMTLKP
jgi:penicillin G amidase